MELTTDLRSIKGVGPNLAAKLKAIGITNINGLLDYFPRTHNDYSKVTPIKALRPGMVTISAKIKQAKGRYVRRGLHITEAVASDETGSIRLIWFNQPYRAGALKADEVYFITGKLELKRQHFSIMNPSVELASDFPLHTARIVPIYRESKGITSSIIRRIIGSLLKSAMQLPNPLPPAIVKKYGLMNYAEAVKELHFPSSGENLDRAKYSLGFLEVFELMLASAINRQEVEHETAPRISFNAKLVKEFVSKLPFKLTDAQRKVTWQVIKDMDKPSPMNRLVEGDVGSGKTVVAAIGGLTAVNQGFQVALLAPTEILARQHAETLSELFRNTEHKKDISLLVGSMNSRQKKTSHQRVKENDIKFIVGTQALLQEKVQFNRLGLLIIDEQHRFGVEQRKALLRQSKFMPHVLSMTATPIPRSLALTLYGELDVSILDEMPPGRKPIKTKIMPPSSRQKLHQLIAKEIEARRQVYVVCPVITEKEKVSNVSAESTYKNLQSSELNKYKIGLLHGKMADKQKESVMKKFKDGDIDLLVSTTVIEVGVSVENASVMVIEGAERFGLAQIHQLRGRVGRGDQQGYCYIIPSDNQAPSRRLRALEQSTNGFKLAELDLELRGPGAIYGQLQHGALDLRLAKLTDTKLLMSARQAVNDFIASNKKLNSYPELARRVRAAQAIVTLN